MAPGLNDFHPLKEKRYGVYANELIKTEVTIQTGPNILELSF